MSASSPKAHPADALPAGSYHAPTASAEAEVREKASRFLAFVAPAENTTQAQAFLAQLRRRFPDATHHCWAWRLGPGGTERSSDDGEPAGTAGAPMLQMLRGANLSDVVAVVVRWFGGTKLGKGGLVRAYGAAVREALMNLPTLDRVPIVRLRLELPYERLGAVKRWLDPPRVELDEERYGETVELVLRVWVAERAALEEKLADLGPMSCVVVD